MMIESCWSKERQTLTNKSKAPVEDLRDRLESLEPLERVQAIAAKAESSNPARRRNLAEALADSPYRFAVPSALELLAGDEDERVRVAAIRAADHRFSCAPKRYSTLLKKACDDDSNRVRSEALAACAKHAVEAHG
jgi:HEAT repeat protein